jgi:hypothetical protein
MIVKMIELIMRGLEEEVEVDRKEKGVDKSMRVKKEKNMEVRGRCLRGRIQVTKCYV